MDILKLWVVEYSLSQQALHVHQVDEAIEANVRMIMNGTSNDYLPIALVDTREEAGRLCDLFLKQLEKRKGAPR